MEKSIEKKLYLYEKKTQLKIRNVSKRGKYELDKKKNTLY